MNRRRLVFASGLVLVLSGWWLQTRPHPDQPQVIPPKASVQIDRPIKAPEVVSDETAIGTAILEGYGKVTQGLHEDLDQLGKLLTSYFTINKAADPLPMASNLDIAAAMRGVNSFRMALLPAKHAAFSPGGEIIDRFGTPIFFHALSQYLVEIRSAGPDGAMWTEDDLQRQPNGTFLHPTSADTEHE